MHVDKSPRMHGAVPFSAGGSAASLAWMRGVVMLSGGKMQTEESISPPPSPKFFPVPIQTSAIEETAPKRMRGAMPFPVKTAVEGSTVLPPWIQITSICHCCYTMSSSTTTISSSTGTRSMVLGSIELSSLQDP